MPRCTWGSPSWAAERAGDRAEEIAELLATHEIEAIGYLDELGERRPEVEREAFDRRVGGRPPDAALKLGAESTRWYREAERLGRSAGDLRRRERASAGPGACRGNRGARTTSLENERVARRAIEIFTALGMTGGVGWADARLVIPLMQQCTARGGRAGWPDAVQILEPLGESEELADALHQLGWFLWRRGREPEAEPLLRRAIDIAEPGGCDARSRGGDADAGRLPVLPRRVRRRLVDSWRRPSAWRRKPGTP